MNLNVIIQLSHATANGDDLEPLCRALLDAALAGGYTVLAATRQVIPDPTPLEPTPATPADAVAP